MLLTMEACFNFAQYLLLILTDEWRQVLTHPFRDAKVTSHVLMFEALADCSAGLLLEALGHQQAGGGSLLPRHPKRSERRKNRDL